MRWWGIRSGEIIKESIFDYRLSFRRLLILICDRVFDNHCSAKEDDRVLSRRAGLHAEASEFFADRWASGCEVVVELFGAAHAVAVHEVVPCLRERTGETVRLLGRDEFRWCVFEFHIF